MAMATAVCIAEAMGIITAGTAGAAITTAGAEVAVIDTIGKIYLRAK